MLMRSSNPVLRHDMFKSGVKSDTKTMTIQGTVNKCFILLLIVLATAAYTWSLFFSQGVVAVRPFIFIGAIGGLIAGFVTYFKQQLAYISAPIYAGCQGLFLGAVSAQFELSYPGIVIQSVGLTFSTMFCLLGAYKSGFIKATENFKLGVSAATAGLFLFYLISFVFSLFGFDFSVFHSSSLIGVGFSLFVVAIAALNLVMDFDFIEQGEQRCLDKNMEWIGAFGLMVTLIWLYLEMLRLLVKLRDRR